jgi:dipeptidyl aminopeptidase/acylaminoacyl peptidase
MTPTATPRPPLEEPPDIDALEALIEEARRRARRRRRRYFGAALLVIAIAVALAYAFTGDERRSGAADAEGAAGGGAAPILSPRNGPLTIFTTEARVNAPSGIARVETIGTGSSKTLWRCPNADWCGQVVSHDWASDGKRLAFSLDMLGLFSDYVGLHVVDVESGQDLHFAREENGCLPPTELDWSPDGTRLAYRCGPGLAYPSSPVVLVVLRVDGSELATIPTETPAYWPSWSPDGRRIAYSTGLVSNTRSHKEWDSSLYTIALDGSHRRLLATDASAPAWSPDGRSIAYQSTCGVRFVTPTGVDSTPLEHANACGALGFPGRPTWSPDGSKLAIETTGGIWVMDADGGNLHRVSRKISRAWYGRQPGRPSWRPSAP